jgi:glycosyltransferase involved in cell wall biosynthesis
LIPATPHTFGEMFLRILIIPQSDWIHSPTDGFHQIAEILAKKHSVYIWHFSYSRSKKSFHEVKDIKLIKPPSIHSNDLSTYYVVNFVPHSLLFNKIVRELRINVIIVQNPIPALWAFTSAPSNVLKVFGFQDYFPESASVYYRGSPQTFRRVVESTSWMVTKLNIKSADICLCPCFSLINLAKKNGCAKSYFLPNGVDTNFYVAEKVDETLRRSLDLSEHTIIVLGLIEPWLDFETVLAGLKILKKDIADAKLLIVGSTLTGYTEELREMVQKFGLGKDVTITGYVTSDLLPHYLNLGAICIMPYKLDTFSGTIRLPLRFFIYSAMAKPILSVHLPEVKRLRPKHVLYYDNPESFANYARMVFQNKKLQQDLSRYARNFSETFDYNVLAEKVEGILEENLKE